MVPRSESLKKYYFRSVKIYIFEKVTNEMNDVMEIKWMVGLSGNESAITIAQVSAKESYCGGKEFFTIFGRFKCIY